MKQLIVLCSTIFLGVAIYFMIMGDHEGSIIRTMADMWQTSLEIRSYTE